MIIDPRILDITASAFGLISTIYSIKNNYRTWPVSLIAICIGIVLYFNKGLYGDMGLHVIYFVFALYGWFQWRYGGNNHNKLPISHMSRKLIIVLSLFLFFGISALALLLYFYTDSKVPLWDASTTVMSLAADFLMCRRIIQCWHLWFFADGLFATMYFYKDLPAHGFLYLLYVGLAVIGYLKWYRDKKLAHDLSVS